MPILPTDRDPSLVTIRRGGTLTDEDHHQIARWAVDCAEHVLPLFEHARPDDTRPRDALDIARAWIRGDVPMKTAHTTAFVANAAGRDQAAPVKYAALAAGQAVAVAHVAAHGLGAAAYAIRAAAADAAARGEDPEAARLAERDRQRDRIPAELRELVLDDQRRRSPICWHVFDD
ncbi:hypothetical protein NSA53_07760 [Cellulosimicrobium cellulans]|uniref:putative immunity protein n=1 Tax=Cellulosimicrobium cellulans TaxID=1710 RepID=UPI002149F3E4|nr:hypothetical protein [Cellulosimicrobium cellulans]